MPECFIIYRSEHHGPRWQWGDAGPGHAEASACAPSPLMSDWRPNTIDRFARMRTKTAWSVPAAFAAAQAASTSIARAAAANLADAPWCAGRASTVHVNAQEEQVWFQHGVENGRATRGRPPNGKEE